MRKLIFLFVSLLLGACQAGPTAEQRAALGSYNQELFAQAQLHKISWAEYAKRTNDRIIFASDPRIGSSKAEIALAYRVYLASEVDANHSTPEYFDFERKRFVADMDAREESQRQAALARASANLMAIGAAMQQKRSFDCTSTHMGNITNTSCD
jgi:hypothetical protein